MSGGRATVRGQRGKLTPHVSGDVCSVHPDGNQFINYFFVEMKNFKDFFLHRMVFGGTGPLLDFWVVAREQAARYNKSPFLIAKQNLFPPMLILTTKLVEAFRVEDLVTCWAPPHDAAFVNWRDFREQVAYSDHSATFRPTLELKPIGRIPSGRVRVGGRSKIRTISARPAL